MSKIITVALAPRRRRHRFSSSSSWFRQSRRVNCVMLPPSVHYSSVLSSLVPFLVYRRFLYNFSFCTINTLMYCDSHPPQTLAFPFVKKSARFVSYANLLILDTSKCFVNVFLDQLSQSVDSQFDHSRNTECKNVTLNKNYHINSLKKKVK